MRSYILLVSSIAVGVRGLGITKKFSCGSHEYTVTASELVDWSYCKVYCSERNLVWAEAHNMEEWQCVKGERRSIDGRKLPRRARFPILAIDVLDLYHK